MGNKQVSEKKAKNTQSKSAKKATQDVLATNLRANLQRRKAAEKENN